MGLIIPKPFDGTVRTSGFSISVVSAKAGQYMRIGITKAAQLKHFGGPLNPETDALILELSDEGKDNHMMRIKLADADESDAFQFKPGIKGSLHMKISPWCQIAAGKRPAVELPVVAAHSQKEVAVKLPEWARPPLKKIGQGKSIMD